MVPNKGRPSHIRHQAILHRAGRGSNRVYSITSSARAGREGGPSSPSVFARPAHERGSIFAILTYSAQALVSLTSSAFSICELPGNGSLPRLARNVFVSSATAI